MPGQLGARASSYAAPYLSRFIGNRFVGSSFREILSDIGGSIMEPFLTHRANQGIDDIRERTGVQVPHVTTGGPTTVPSLFGSVIGNYLVRNRTYMQARATQTFHGPNTNEGINNFVHSTDDAVHIGRLWEEI
jgi:hypothetical protein